MRRRASRRSGCDFRARAVVLTAGTFLAGKIHVGLAQLRRPAAPAIRRRARSAHGCASCRCRVGRLKTGTPPRIDGRTHRFRRAGTSSRATIRAPVFSLHRARATMHPRQVPLLDHAHQRAHARDHPRRAATARRCTPAQIEGIGPRYCPSIEDKVVRFAEQGDATRSSSSPKASTRTRSIRTASRPSLPFDVQLALVRIDRGLRARAHHAARLCDRVRLSSIRAG